MSLPNEETATREARTQEDDSRRVARKPGAAVARTGWLEWLWQSARARELAARARQMDPRATEWLRRARLTLEVAHRCVDGGESYEGGDPAPVACELYRQAIYWALLAHQVLSRGEGDTRHSPELGSGHAFAELWDAATDLLLDAAGDGVTLKRHEAGLKGRAFDDFFEAGSASPSALSDVRSFADAVIREVDATTRALERLWLTRLVRAGLVVLLGLVLVGGAVLAFASVASPRTDANDRAIDPTSRRAADDRDATSLLERRPV
ncbi:MAG: hypothetical protein DIU78_003470 [Pseudomonadota bacterium]